MHSKVSQPDEMPKRARNKTADTADNAQQRHRSKLLKPTGAFGKKMSGISKGRPQSRDTTSTPVSLQPTPKENDMKTTATEIQQLQFNPAFAVQDRNAGIRANTSSVPHRARLQRL